MRKEVFLAIFIGLVMGLFITYGIYHAQTNQEEAATDVKELETDPQPTTSPEKLGQLAIYNPTDESIISDTDIKVTGKTTADSQVVIFVNDKPYITRSDDTGNFTKDVELDELSNVIKVHSIEEDGKSLEAQKTVIVYDGSLEAADLNDLEDESKAATESAETEKIEEEEEEEENN